MMTMFKATVLGYSIRPITETKYARDIKSNTIHTIHIGAITSQRSFNGRDALLEMTMIIMSIGYDPINERYRIPFLQVNSARSSVGEPTVLGAILPLNRRYHEQNAKLKDECESPQW